MTREEALTHIMQRSGTWTTRELAAELGCKEYRIRAVVAWLCIGGHVRIVDAVIEGIPDLLRMPPEPPRQPKPSPVLGELAIKEGGRTISEREITADEAAA